MSEVFPFINVFYSELTFTIRDSFTFVIPDTDLFKAIGIYIGIDVVSGVNLSFNFKSKPSLSFYGYATVIHEDLPESIIPLKCSPMWVYRWDCPDFYSTSATFAATQVNVAMLKQLLSLLPQSTPYNIVPRFSRSPIREVHFELNPLTQADIRIGFLKLPQTITTVDGDVLNPHTDVPPPNKPDRRGNGNKYNNPANNTENNPYPNSKNFPNPTNSPYGNPSQLGDPSQNVDPPVSQMGVGDSVTMGPNGQLYVNGNPANNSLSPNIEPLPTRFITVSYQPMMNGQPFGSRQSSMFESNRFPKSFSFPNPNGICENSFQIWYISPYNNQLVNLDTGCNTDFRIDG